VKVGVRADVMRYPDLRAPLVFLFKRRETIFVVESVVIIYLWL